MSVTIDRVIKTIWHDWSPGEVENCEDSIFQEVVFDKTPEGYRVRLVFEVDLSNQNIVNLVYKSYPAQLEIALSNLGKIVLRVEATGSIDRCSYRVDFKDGSWFLM